MNLRRALAVLPLLAVLLLVAGPASAHVELRESEPAAGAKLTEPPAEVFIRFTGLVIDDSFDIVVRDPDGKRVETEATQSGARAAAVALPELTTSGRYTVIYRGQSEDGHELVGRYRFRLQVDEAAAEEPGAEEPAEEEPTDGGVASESVSEPAGPNDAEDDPALASEDLEQGSPWLLLGGLAVVAAVAAIAISRRRNNT